VKVGDVVCVYTAITRTGRSSITLGVEAWVLRRGQGERVRVTAAEFVLVAVDEAGRPGGCRMPPEVAGPSIHLSWRMRGGVNSSRVVIPPPPEGRKVL
jgi:acyl-CoA hydrolase